MGQNSNTTKLNLSTKCTYSNQTHISKSNNFHEPVQKLCRTIRLPISRKNGRKHGVHIASQAHPRIIIPFIVACISPIHNAVSIAISIAIALLLAIESVVPIAEEIVSQRRSVKQSLQNRIHEARVSEIVESAQSPG